MNTFFEIIDWSQPAIRPNETELDAHDDESDSSLLYQLIFHQVVIDIIKKSIPKNCTLDPEEVSTIIGIYATQYHPNSRNVIFFKQC